MLGLNNSTLNEVVNLELGFKSILHQVLLNKHRFVQACLTGKTECKFSSWSSNAAYINLEILFAKIGMVKNDLPTTTKKDIQLPQKVLSRNMS